MSKLGTHLDPGAGPFDYSCATMSKRSVMPVNVLFDFGGLVFAAAGVVTTGIALVERE
ncbi:MAG: hypothetical protein ACRDK7_11285 [Solirubrobacteraceae bacterium]